MGRHFPGRWFLPGPLVGVNGLLQILTLFTFPSMMKNGEFPFVMMTSYLSFFAYPWHWQSITGYQFWVTEMFRKFFDSYNPASVANLSEEKLLSITTNNSSLLSEPKVRAIVDNAKQILQVQKHFGSFSSYCWRFVNNKPIRSGYRYQRQVPVKIPKAELISKDLMCRSFCGVGPTVIYSFMQVAGMVNDHLTTCFQNQE